MPRGCGDNGIAFETPVCRCSGGSECERLIGCRSGSVQIKVELGSIGLIQRYRATDSEIATRSFRAKDRHTSCYKRNELWMQSISGKESLTAILEIKVEHWILNGADLGSCRCGTGGCCSWRTRRRSCLTNCCGRRNSTCRGCTSNGRRGWRSYCGSTGQALRII